METAAHQSNLAEIAAGTAAQNEASSEDVRRLGAMFIEMPTALDADLTAAAQQLGVSLPAAPSPEQQAQLNSVTANDGAAFDTAWIAQQLGSHSTSDANSQRELAEGEDPAVLALTRAAALVIQQHLTHSQACGPCRRESSPARAAAPLLYSAHSP